MNGEYCTNGKGVTSIQTCFIHRVTCYDQRYLINLYNYSSISGWWHRSLDRLLGPEHVYRWTLWRGERWLGNYMHGRLLEFSGVGGRQIWAFRGGIVGQWCAHFMKLGLLSDDNQIWFWVGMLSSCLKLAWPVWANEKLWARFDLGHHSRMCANSSGQAFFPDAHFYNGI